MHGSIEERIAEKFLITLDDVPMGKDELIDAPLSGLGLNSLTFIKTIVLVESEFDIEIEPENLNINVFSSIRSFAEYVKSIIE